MPADSPRDILAEVMDRSVGSEWHVLGTGLSGGFCGFVFITEDTQCDVPSVDRHLGPPSTLCLVPGDTTELRRSGLTGDVLPVRSVGAGSQVSSPAVQTVPVDVIDLSIVVSGQSQYLPVKADRVSSGFVAFVANYIAERAQVPAPLVDEVGIGSINECVGANRPITGSQGDTYGILKAHRVPPELGVTPRPVLAGAGLPCVNYTTHSLVGA